jgi:hypothetical protein
MKDFFENEKYGYRKKKDQFSKSNRRSDHKHDYEKIIVPGLFGYMFAQRCTLCGRIKHYSFAQTRYKEFLKGNRRNSFGIGGNDIMTPDEIHAAFPGIRIFTYDRNSDGHLDSNSELHEIIFQ